MREFKCFLTTLLRNLIFNFKIKIIILYFKKKCYINCIHFEQIRILFEKVLFNKPSRKVYKFIHILKIKIKLLKVC